MKGKTEMKEIINSKHVPDAVGPYSQAVSVNMKDIKELVYTSGQLPIDKNTNTMPSSIEEQTKQALLNVINILNEKDMTVDNVIKTTVYLSDIKNFKLMNEVYQIFFRSPYPSRSAFEVAALPLGALIEIEVVAAK